MARSTGSSASSVATIDDVANWLIAQALDETDFKTMFAGCCERMAAAGVPLWRGHIAFTVLHPLYSGMGITWLRGRGAKMEGYQHIDGDDVEKFRSSTLYHMIEHRLPVMRRRLTGKNAELDFPYMVELRDKGATDYLGFLIRFGGGARDGMVGSWTTDRPGGFSARDIKALMRLQQRLGVACKMRVKDEVAKNVVTAYMGRDAGLRILNGQIRRGQGETIRAVIWYSDLRQSTRLAERLPRDDYIDVLNAYFECAGGAVEAHGGDILNFIGDAVLAIFPIAKGQATARQACRQALAASHDAREMLSAVNAERRERGAKPLDFGLGLHVGEVLFGNIGIPDRVSFSVIGPTVNEVARLEALTKRLKQPVLATQSFAKNVNIDWTHLGRHRLRGVGEPIEVYAPG